MWAFEPNTVLTAILKDPPFLFKQTKTCHIIEQGSLRVTKQIANYSTLK